MLGFQPVKFVCPATTRLKDVAQEYVEICRSTQGIRDISRISFFSAVRLENTRWEDNSTDERAGDASVIDELFSDEIQDRWNQVPSSPDWPAAIRESQRGR